MATIAASVSTRAIREHRRVLAPVALEIEGEQGQGPGDDHERRLQFDGEEGERIPATEAPVELCHRPNGHFLIMAVGQFSCVTWGMVRITVEEGDGLWCWSCSRWPHRRRRSRAQTKRWNPPTPPAVRGARVSTALDSCGTLEDEVICKLDVSYNALPEAASYSAAVTRADGSVVDYGGVAPGGTSLWVPYVGSGTYSVRVTAYGAPEQPDGDKEVVSTEVTPTETETEVREATSEAEVEASSATSEAEAETRGAPEAETDTGQRRRPSRRRRRRPPAPRPRPSRSRPSPCPSRRRGPRPGEPDEDADGIPDEQERRSTTPRSPSSRPPRRSPRCRVGRLLSPGALRSNN